jgi:hypothetical protein
LSRDADEAARRGMQPLDPGFGDEHAFVCTPALPSCVVTLGWITTIMPAAKVSSGSLPDERVVEPMIGGR